MNDAVADLGALAQAGLAARAIDAPAVRHDAEHPTDCANCGTRLIGPHCHDCGQRGHIHRTVPHLLEEIGHGVFHFEGKVWRTLPLLLFRPGELTRRYVHGERTRFVSPMALFLFTVFLMFAVVGNIGGGVHVNGRAADRERYARVTEAIAATEAVRDTTAAAGRPTAALDAQLARLEREQATAGGVFLSGSAGETLSINTGWKTLDRRLMESAANPELVIYKLKSSAYKFSWALIPISLPFLWLLFPFRRGVALYDHAVFATYSLSFMSMLVVAGALIGLVSGGFAAVLLLAVPVHMFAQLKGAYLLSRWGALWRTVAMLFFCLVTSLTFVLLILALDLWH